MPSSDSLAIYRAQLRDRKTNSYMLCIVGLLVPIGGLHRLYNGKIVSGLFWMMTFGCFYIGQVVDLLLIPGMAEERTRKFYGDPVARFDTPSLTKPPTESLQKR
ncbi:MAG: TM2 domain-containing protein, partial [Cyanobacteria bacterium J06627_15]